MALSPHAPAHLANNLSGDMAGTRNPTTAVSPKTRHTPQEKGGPKAALFTNQTNFVFRIGRSRTRFPVAATIAFAIDGGTGGTPGSPTPAANSLLLIK